MIEVSGNKTGVAFIIVRDADNDSFVASLRIVLREPRYTRDIIVSNKVNNTTSARLSNSAKLPSLNDINKFNIVIKDQYGDEFYEDIKGLNDAQLGGLLEKVSAPNTTYKFSFSSGTLNFNPVNADRGKYTYRLKIAGKYSNNFSATIEVPDISLGASVDLRVEFSTTRKTDIVYNADTHKDNNGYMTIRVGVYYGGVLDHYFELDKTKNPVTGTGSAKQGVETFSIWLGRSGKTGSDAQGKNYTNNLKFTGNADSVTSDANRYDRKAVLPYFTTVTGPAISGGFAMIATPIEGGRYTPEIVLWEKGVKYEFNTYSKTTKTTSSILIGFAQPKFWVTFDKTISAEDKYADVLKDVLKFWYAGNDKNEVNDTEYVIITKGKFGTAYKKNALGAWIIDPDKSFKEFNGSATAEGSFNLSEIKLLYKIQGTQNGLYSKAGLYYEFGLTSQNIEAKRVFVDK